MKLLHQRKLKLVFQMSQNTPCYHPREPSPDTSHSAPRAALLLVQDVHVVPVAVTRPAVWGTSLCISRTTLLNQNFMTQALCQDAVQKTIHASKNYTWGETTGGKR